MAAKYPAIAGFAYMLLAWPVLLWGFIIAHTTVIYIGGTLAWLGLLLLLGAVMYTLRIEHRLNTRRSATVKQLSAVLKGPDAHVVRLEKMLAVDHRETARIRASLDKLSIEVRDVLTSVRRQEETAHQQRDMDRLEFVAAVDARIVGLYEALRDNLDVSAGGETDGGS
jgi:hypothetical protein